MSLRLWSERIPLAPVVEQLNFAASQLHVTDRPMAKDGRLAERLARRHYASAANANDRNDADVSTWCRLIMSGIASQASIVDLLRTGQIDGVLWITVLGGESAPTPELTEDIVKSATQLKLDIFLRTIRD